MMDIFGSQLSVGDKVAISQPYGQVIGEITKITNVNRYLFVGLDMEEYDFQMQQGLSGRKQSYRNVHSSRLIKVSEDNYKIFEKE